MPRPPCFCHGFLPCRLRLLLRILGEFSLFFSEIRVSRAFPSSCAYPMTSTASDQREEVAAKRRRVAAQRVRDARDRLTSTTGTRPAFDYELLRLFAQNRLSASLVVLLLVTTVGFLSSLWTGAVTAGIWTAGVLMIHAVIITKCKQFLSTPPSEINIKALAAALHHARPVLRARLDVQPDRADRRGGRHRHLHAVRDAARGRGVEHAGIEPADRGVRRDRAGHRRRRAELRPQGHAALLHPRRHGDHRAGLFPPARASSLFVGAGDVAGARREGHADRRTRTGESDLGRGAQPRRGRQHFQVALPRADEPRACARRSTPFSASPK